MSTITTHEVALQSFETVMRGGVRRVTWLLSTDEDWTLVSEQPNARVTNLDRGPGVVWRREVIVTLPVGARLMRVESMPERAAPRDPLAYLLGSPGGPGRKTRRNEFVVAPGGVLERVPPRERER
jgi:hypothetical protein